MKIVLVFPPFYLESMYNLPPLGLINLATAVRASSRDIVILDFVLALRQKTLKMGTRIYDDCADSILEEKPDLVGLSVQCTTFPAAIQICKRIRERRSDVKIVLGGHNASFVADLTLRRFPFFDAVVRGEGEITFRELVEAYESGAEGRGIPGITYRTGGEVIQNPDRALITDLAELPLPDYRFAQPLSAYRDACGLPRSIAILEVGRGCPHRCIYCSESIFWRRKSRTFSIPRLVAEMKNLYQNFGAECFLLAYDQFTAKRSFVESFCRDVIQAGLNHIPWYCISRLDSVDAPLLALMKEAGCESMCYGIDSGSERTLAFIRKQIDRNILYQRVTETAQQGIIPTLSFVIGFPEEEKSDIDETLKLALQSGIVGNNNPLVQLPTVLPGTDLYEGYRHRLVRRVDTYFSLGLEFHGGHRLTADEALIDSSPELFSSFYNLPCPGMSLEDLNLLANYFPLIVRFYPKTFILLSIHLATSVSDLFIRWTSWLSEHLDRKDPSFSPQDCYRYFRSFVSHILNEKGLGTFEHLPDVLKYETLALETGKAQSKKTVFDIDLHGSLGFRPTVQEGIILGAFEFHLPTIVGDLKTGSFQQYYPREKTHLVFKQEDDLLEVSEINEFGRNFLELCDGTLTVGDISEQLYPLYGQDMDRNAFRESCVEALHALLKMGFFESRNRAPSVDRDSPVLGKVH
jgi:radical SAM superfamily enzyme YgiQ (UPF0313 family)